MTPRQKIAALSLVILILVSVVELVRRRKLRAEYSFLWLTTTLIMLIFVIRYDWLVALTYFIGVVAPTSTIFFLGLLFLVAINIHFSVQISKLSNRVKNLGQENALLKNRLEKDDT